MTDQTNEELKVEEKPAEQQPEQQPEDPKNKLVAILRTGPKLESIEIAWKNLMVDMYKLGYRDGFTDKTVGLEPTPRGIAFENDIQKKPESEPTAPETSAPEAPKGEDNED